MTSFRRNMYTTSWCHSCKKVTPMKSTSRCLAAHHPDRETVTGDVKGDECRFKKCVEQWHINGKMDNYAKKISSEKETHLIDIEYNIIIRNTLSEHFETRRNPSMSAHANGSFSIRSSKPWALSKFPARAWNCGSNEDSEKQLNHSNTKRTKQTNKIRLLISTQFDTVRCFRDV